MSNKKICKFCELPVHDNHEYCCSDHELMFNMQKCKICNLRAAPKFDFCCQGHSIMYQSSINSNYKCKYCKTNHAAKGFDFCCKEHSRLYFTKTAVGRQQRETVETKDIDELLITNNKYTNEKNSTLNGLPNRVTPNGLPNTSTPNGLPNTATPSGLLNTSTPNGLLNRAKETKEDINYLSIIQLTAKEAGVDEEIVIRKLCKIANRCVYCRINKPLQEGADYCSAEHETLYLKAAEERQNAKTCTFCNSKPSSTNKYCCSHKYLASICNVCKINNKQNQYCST